MVFLRLALAAIGLISTLAFASPGDPRTGAEFQTLPVQQDVKATGNKVETSPTHAASRSGDQSSAAAMTATMQVLDVLVAKSRAENAAAQK